MSHLWAVCNMTFPASLDSPWTICWPLDFFLKGQGQSKACDFMQALCAITSSYSFEVTFKTKMTILENTKQLLQGE